MDEKSVRTLTLARRHRMRLCCSGDVTETGAPPRIYLITAVILAAALAGTLIVLGLLFSSDGEESADPAPPEGPLPLVPVPAPEAESPQCTELVQAAPEQLKSSGEFLSRRKLAEPAPPAAIAWGPGDAVVLRCGLDRPPELTRTSSLRMINDVQWLEVSGHGSSSWFVVDREVYVALTVPDDAGTGVLQDISDTVRQTLPEAPLRFD